MARTERGSWPRFGRYRDGKGMVVPRSALIWTRGRGPRNQGGALEIEANSSCIGTSRTLNHDPFNPSRTMARICAITGKRPVKGSIINRKGQSKKSGGIGTHVTSITKRKFRPNLQRIRIKLPNGGTKRLLVSVKAIKAGLVQKA
jgi:large subunit ribosomal protein L28